jgi:hypothetical protein
VDRTIANPVMGEATTTRSVPFHDFQRRVSRKKPPLVVWTRHSQATQGPDDAWEADQRVAASGGKNGPFKGDRSNNAQRSVKSGYDGHGEPRAI